MGKVLHLALALQINNEARSLLLVCLSVVHLERGAELHIKSAPIAIPIPIP